MTYDMIFYLAAVLVIGLLARAWRTDSLGTLGRQAGELISFILSLPGFVVAYVVGCTVVGIKTAWTIATGGNNNVKL